VRGAAIVLDPLKPANKDAYAGASVTLEVSASGGFGAGGTPSFSYQWWFTAPSQAAVALPGPDAATLVLSPVALADAGQYYCVVTDDSPYPAQSRTATVRVGTPLVITTYPLGAVKNVGEKHTMTVATTGGVGALTYTWKKNGVTVASDVDLTSYTTPELTYPAYDHASYVVSVSDESSMPAVSTADAPAIITLANIVTVPALGAAGLGFLAAAMALKGVIAARRRKH